MNQKQIIKKLAAAINDVLESTCEANEMAALIDYGEWSQTGPDFSGIIQTWNLTREKLAGFCDQAEQYAAEFGRQIPTITRTTAKAIYKYGPYIANPWEGINQTLHCIFINGDLQDPIDEPEPTRHRRTRRNPSWRKEID